MATASIVILGHGFVAAVLVAVGSAVCSPVWAGTLEGTATYRERIALPPDAIFEVVLQDVSRADAPADVGGARTTPPPDRPIPNGRVLR